MGATANEPVGQRRPHPRGAAWVLCVGFLLSAVALGFGAWFAWRVVAFYSLCTEDPEYLWVVQPARLTLWCVARTVPPLICAAISMLCAVIGLPSPVRWHGRLALAEFIMSCLAVILLLLCYWAAWGPVYYVTMPGG
jgi:hypothetical protein